jgi:hypothetical protein
LVEELEHEHEAVDPRRLAERVVDAHSHLVAVRAYREELRAAVEDYVRELRAASVEER